MPPTPIGSITFARHADRFVITMTGDIDLSVVTEEHLTTVARLAPAAAAVDVDMAAVTFLDSVALGFLITVRNSNAVPARLRGTPARQRSVLQHAGLDSLFTFDE